MECNREEANRAKQIAEQKMQKNDFAGGRKFAEKAQRLFPDLENISQLLTVCEVHCSAENKLYGSLMDWYKILQLEQLAGEAAIKKQYRKLALLLHPDKNKFAGAEAAFKLIGEANRVLADPSSRSMYDNRYKTAVKVPAPKPSSHQVNGKTSVSQQQHVAANCFQKVPNTLFSGTYHHLMSFWTSCCFCNIRYEYPKSVLHCRMLCQNCQRTFTAYDMGAQSIATGSSRGPFQNNGSVPNQGTKMASENGKASKGKRKELGSAKKVKETVNVQTDKEDVVKSKSEAPVKPKESATTRNTKRKRGRSSAAESSESCTDSEEDSVFQENGGNPHEGLERRKSSRQKQGVSYNEKLGDNDDDFVNSVKRSRGGDSSNNNAAPTAANCNEEKSKVDVDDDDDDEDDDDDDDDTSDPETIETIECPDPDFSNFEKDKAENCFEVDQIWAAYDDNDGMPRFYARVRKVFSPGFKLKITWLEANPDKQDADEVKWCKKLPAACGKFKLGDSQVTEELPMFSHKVTWMKGPGRNCFLVYPLKGEIWALFKNWDIRWHAEPEKHKPFKFEIVEVLSDFDGVSGITVACLGKVKGFVSLFRRTKLHGITSFKIKPTEIYRFSHQIPSFKMTGAEGEGVPEGSVELDPASLPTDLDYFADAAMKDGKADSELNGPCPNSPEKKVKQAAGSKKNGTPKKQEKNDHEGEAEECRKSPRQQNNPKNHSQVDRSQCASKMGTDEPLDSSIEEKLSNRPRPGGKGGKECLAGGIATSSKAEKQVNTPKKEKNASKKETLKSRRSPRALNNKQV